VATDQTLERLLERYFGAEERDLRCDTCGGDKVQVTPTLTRLPRTLVLHLKRFEYSPTAMAYVKNAQHIAIPASLDIAPYCASDPVDRVVQPFSSDAGVAVVAAYVDAAGSTNSDHAASASGGRLCVPPGVPGPHCSVTAGVEVTMTPVATAGAGTEGTGSRIGKGGKDTAIEVSPDGVDALHGVHGGGGLSSPSPTTPATATATTAATAPDSDSAFMSSGRLPGTCYTLSAVVRHHGANAGAGHYTADVRRSSSSSSSSTSTWERCDDSLVGAVTQPDVLDDRSSSYLLMYTHASLA
jgi:hypothetical protein